MYNNINEWLSQSRNLEELEGFDNFQSIQSQIVDNIIKQRLEEMSKIFNQIIGRLGYNVDFSKAKKRRFKEIQVEYSHSIKEEIETWYYNDGTDEGLKVITFIHNTKLNGMNLTNDTNYIDHTLKS